MVVSEFLRSIHVPGNYIGFRQLCRAVELAVDNEDALFNIYRNIYGIIAQETGTTVKAVEKNIRTVIAVAWLRGCKSSMRKLTGLYIDAKPSAGEFLDIISAFLRSHAAEEAKV